MKIRPSSSAFWTALLVIALALGSVVAFDARAGSQGSDADEQGPSSESSVPDDEETLPTPVPTPT